MSVTTSRMHIKQLNHKILQVKVNTMRSSDILSQRPQHLCTGVYTSKLMRPVHSKVEVRLMHSDNYSRIYYESLSKSSNFSSYRLYVWPHKSLIFFTKFVHNIFCCNTHRPSKNICDWLLFTPSQGIDIYYTRACRVLVCRGALELYYMVG